MTVKAPKKMINVNGIMKLNPEYTRWKEMNDAGSHEPDWEHVVTDATGVPMVAATFIPEENTTDSPPAYQAPHAVSSEPQATTVVTTRTYTIPPPQQQHPHQQQQPVPANAAYRGTPVYHNTSLGRKSAQLTCPNCHQHTTTNAKETIGPGTIIAIVCLLIFCWPLFWLPLVMPDCMQIDHYCRNCGAKVGESPSSCCSC